MELGGEFLGRKGRFPFEERQDLPVYTDICPDIYTDIFHRFRRHIDVLVERIADGIEHEADERAAIDRIPVRILQRMAAHSAGDSILNKAVDTLNLYWYSTHQSMSEYGPQGM